MTDPNTAPDSPVAAVLICVIMLIGLPLGLWVAMTWTKQQWAAAWRTVKRPPVSHAAHTYRTCHIHGQRIPTNGDCAICINNLHADLETLEWGE